MLKDNAEWNKPSCWWELSCVFRRRCRVSVHPLAPVCNQMSLVGELGELSTCCTLKLYLATKYTFTEKLKEGAEGLWRPFGYLRSALNRRFPYWSLEDQLDPVLTLEVGNPNRRPLSHAHCELRQLRARGVVRALAVPVLPPRSRFASSLRRRALADPPTVYQPCGSRRRAPTLVNIREK